MKKHQKSLWTAEVSAAEFAEAVPLPEAADVVVVGAGISGLTTAVLLAQAGKRVVVVDKEATPGSGETGNTTAHLTQLFDTGYVTIRKNFGDQAAKQVAEGLAGAIDTVAKLAEQGGVPCGVARVPAYLYASCDAEQREVDDEADALAALGVAVRRVEKLPLPYATPGPALCLDDQAQFQPLAYLAGLSRMLRQLRGRLCTQVRFTGAEELDGTVVVDTSAGKIRAEHLVLATHTPPNKLVLQTKMTPLRTYVLAVRCAEPFPAGLYYDTSEPYHYLRSHVHDGKQVVLVGGADHRAGASEGSQKPFAPLETFVREHLVATEVVAAWSGMVFEPADGLPYVGLNPGTQRTYVITGLSGDGMTAGTLGASVVSQTILGQAPALASVFDPSRIKPVAGGVEWAKHNVAVSGHMVGDRVKAWLRTEPLAPGEGKVMRQGLHAAAVYNDDGAIRAVSPVCPHAGCYVQFNAAKKCWDCPCHGSQFATDGKLLADPAVSDLTPLDP